MATEVSSQSVQGSDEVVENLSESEMFDSIENGLHEKSDEQEESINSDDSIECSSVKENQVNKQKHQASSRSPHKVTSHQNGKVQKPKNTKNMTKEYLIQNLNYSQQQQHKQQTRISNDHVS